MIDSSMDKVLQLLEQLFEFREIITLGIAKNALLFEQEWLDKNNPVYRDFASALAQCGVATISFIRHPTRDELIQFINILRSDRQTIIDSGGFDTLLSQLQVTHIQMSSVDYSSFHTTDEEHLEGKQHSATLWEDFLGTLIAGETDTQEGHEETSSSLVLDPKIVADILNQKYQLQENNSDSDYDQVISTFISQYQHSGQQKSSTESQFAELIGQLTPELRRQFLNSAFRNFDPDNKSTEAVLDQLPTEVILESLEDFNQNHLNISSNMVNLLGKLSSHRQQDQQSLISGSATGSNSELKEQLGSIFREEDQGKFTPESYQQALDRIVRFDDSISLPDEDISKLQQQLHVTSTERHSCAIILKLLRPDLDTEQADGLQNNLIDLAHFFLEIGDFKGLKYLHCGVLKYLSRYPQSPPEQTDRLLFTLTDSKFQLEVIDNLQRWGEDKQRDIRAYIQATGAAFATSLVNRLAHEEDKGLRRLYLNTLVGMGEAAHQSIYAMLSDSRWFLIRNLLTVLRLQKDPIDLEKIYPLETHHNLRVNQELLKLLFKYDRSRADSLLLKQLSNYDPEIQAHAIQLAEQSTNPEISEKLAQILGRDKITDSNLPLKISIVKTLGQVGSDNVLSQLEKLLFSGRVFKSAALDQLKLEIVKNFDNYPFEKVKPLLIKLVSARKGELSRLATEKLRQLVRSSL
jgi:hypothetical protein